MEARSRQTPRAAPVLQSGVKHHSRAVHVREDEAHGVGDGVVDVAFRSEVNDAVDLVLIHQIGDGRFVADVAVHGDHVRHGCLHGEGFFVGGIGERIQVDQTIGRIFAGKVLGEVRADEPGAARDQNGLHIGCQLRCAQASAKADSQERG